MNPPSVRGLFWTLSPLFQPALSSLGLSSKKKCSNEMLDKIKAILRDT